MLRACSMHVSHVACGHGHRPRRTRERESSRSLSLRGNQESSSRRTSTGPWIHLHTRAQRLAEVHPLALGAARPDFRIRYVGPSGSWMRFDVDAVTERYTESKLESASSRLLQCRSPGKSGKVSRRVTFLPCSSHFLGLLPGDEYFGKAACAEARGPTSHLLQSESGLFEE